MFLKYAYIITAPIDLDQGPVDPNHSSAYALDCLRVSSPPGRLFITASEPLFHSHHVAAKAGTSTLKEHRDTVNFPLSRNTH